MSSETPVEYNTSTKVKTNNHDYNKENLGEDLSNLNINENKENSYNKKKRGNYDNNRADRTEKNKFNYQYEKEAAGDFKNEDFYEETAYPEEYNDMLLNEFDDLDKEDYDYNDGHHYNKYNNQNNQYNASSSNSYGSGYQTYRNKQRGFKVDGDEELWNKANNNEFKETIPTSNAPLEEYNDGFKTTRNGKSSFDEFKQDNKKKPNEYHYKNKNTPSKFDEQPKRGSHQSNSQSMHLPKETVVTREKKGSVYSTASTTSKVQAPKRDSVEVTFTQVRIIYLILF